MAKSRVLRKREAGIPLHKPRDSPAKRKVMLRMRPDFTALCYDKPSQCYEVCRWKGLGWTRIRRPTDAELAEATAIREAMLARRRPSPH